MKEKDFYDDKDWNWLDCIMFLAAVGILWTAIAFHPGMLLLGLIVFGYLKYRDN